MSNPCDRCGLSTERDYQVWGSVFQGWLCDRCHKNVSEFVEKVPEYATDTKREEEG